MNGKIVYFSLASLMGVLCSIQSFLLFGFLTLIYLLILRKVKRFSPSKIVFLIVVFLLFNVSTQFKMNTNKTKIQETETNFFLSYNYETKIDGDLLQFIGYDIRFNEKIIVRYQIHSETEKTGFENKNFFGHLCKLEGPLKKPQIAKNENAFNYREYLNRNGVFWIVESKGNPFTTCIKEKENFILFLKQIRFQGIKYLHRNFPPEVAALSSALLFGDRSLMDPEVLSDYQRVGIIHLLAISGLHVSLLIGMLYYMGLRVGATREFMINFILMILPVYAILTGGSPSVIRAVLMIFLVMATMKWKIVLKLNPLDAISLAFSIFLFFDPLVLFDVGFQLSFSVSFAIILSAPSILQRYQNSLSKMIVISVISQISALPFLLFHFYGASMISIVANLIYIPLFSFILLPGLYLLFLFQLLFGTLPIWIMNFFVKVIQSSSLLVNNISHFSFAEIVPGKPSWFFLILYAVVIIAIFFIWETEHFTAKQVLLLCLGSFLFTFQQGWNRIDPVGEVTMIDVGQGDSILIHLPYGKGNYLIDTGGSLQFSESQWRMKARPFEVGKDVVVPYLKGKGITKIDKLILTHGDMDHIGGAFSLIKELKVKQIVMPSIADPSETEMAIEKEAKMKKIQIVKVSDGYYWENSNSFFQILSPEKNFVGVRNRGSIGLFAGIGGLTWFFGGDLDQVGEEEIIKKYPKLSFDVLKVGHHGSKTSSSQAFLNQCKPKISLLSVGEKNRYGHPNQEVLQGLKQIHSTIYRTDNKGAITYKFYQGEGTFSTFLP
ncbi:DNA internalization-related competence protein ComEC/Rec2 [Neobacillus sp. PS3-40]|uniref:DNA internalization-related competence protein ComEC/Rec2 n=1 Tax=Neobacillus sp. PS3-40 TaxID=3070679 RepID=UPI0027DFA984|nr:DNA internalization-related competence protein ComEC/Rec2 [Neobacillus sp. PS3-40]WML45372.1 DNA internalization-related competence protein ComEC/Rec2 [Neobacillus sp. PS3-40]